MNKIIKLIDGGELECYEIESTTQQENIDNSLQLDTTGVYLQIGNRKRRNKTPKTKIQDRPEVRLFVEHAHFFFEHSEEIRQDSRMFLSPIPFNNGLAYTGESGFQHPTLGVYIEWRLSNQEVLHFRFLIIPIVIGTIKNSIVFVFIITNVKPNPF